MKKILYLLFVFSLLFITSCNQYKADPLQATSVHFDLPVSSKQFSQAEVLNEIHTYKIEYDFILKSNDSVGNDWYSCVTYDGEQFKSGDTITATANSLVLLTATVTENDSVADSASQSLTLRLSDGEKSTVKLVVTENRGAYSGNTAVWEVCCSAWLVS